MQFAQVNGVVLHYQVIGAAKNKPHLVFANALGTDFRIWRDVIVQLAGEFSILAYDMRGHGLSDVGTTPHTLEDHVWDLGGLLDHAEISEAILCGISLGGMAALGLHAARPELVKALILCGVAHKVAPAEAWDATIEAVEAEGLASLSDALITQWTGEDYRDADNLGVVGYRNMVERQSSEGFAAACAAIRDADLTSVARDVDVPTLCVVGDQDEVTPVSVVQELSELIDGADVEIVADCGHWPPVERPLAVADLITGFVSRMHSGTN